MRKTSSASMLLFILFTVWPEPSDAQTAAPSASALWVAPDPGFTYAVIIVVFLAILIIFAAVGRVLGSQNSKWSLADALSEETDLTVDDDNHKPYTVNGVVVKKTEMRASSSRLIAFIGTIAILMLFLGFGAFILWNFANTGAITGASDIRNYLFAGLTLFAPYVVNKFSSVFAPK